MYKMFGKNNEINIDQILNVWNSFSISSIPQSAFVVLIMLSAIRRRHWPPTWLISHWFQESYTWLRSTSSRILVPSKRFRIILPHTTCGHAFFKSHSQNTQHKTNSIRFTDCWMSNWFSLFSPYYFPISFPADSQPIPTPRSGRRPSFYNKQNSTILFAWGVWMG